MKMLRSTLLTCLFLVVLYQVASSFCNRQTDGFSIARIHSDLSYNPAWETAALKLEEQQELDCALAQKFYYLGCGGQCFAFGSEDGRYVIKFFKHRIRKPYSYFLKASLVGPLEKARQRKLSKALFKLKRDFTSYKIAFDELREETGIIYLHLNKTAALSRSVLIVDKLGIEHRIPLDDIEFVVQRQAELVYTRIANLMASGDRQAARQTFHALLEVIVNRCQKGVFDEDPRLHRNFGFVGDTPIFIDVGRFVRDPSRKDPAVYKADLRAITKRFRSDLEESHPELVCILDEELQAFQN